MARAPQQPQGAASNPLARAHWIPIHPGTALCAYDGSHPSRPRPFPLCRVLSPFSAYSPRPAPSHDVRSFVGACNFYRRRSKNFTYTSATLTNLIKKSTTWRLTSSRTKWLTPSPWACPGHKGKLSW